MNRKIANISEIEQVPNMTAAFLLKCYISMSYRWTYFYTNLYLITEKMFSFKQRVFRIFS